MQRTKTLTGSASLFGFGGKFAEIRQELYNIDRSAKINLYP